MGLLDSDSDITVKTQTKTVVFVARMTPEKSPGLLLQAVFHVEKAMQAMRQNATEIGGEPPDQINYLFVGDGALQDHMKIYARAIQNAEFGMSNISFLGWMDRAELVNVLSTADLIVNPS